MTAISHTIRSQFPALEQQVHGHPLAYLDSAATSLKPQCVIDAVTSVYSRDTGNIDRGVHTLAERASARYRSARERVAAFLRAEVDEVIFCGGTTEALNLVAHGWANPNLNPGDRIVVSVLEHHSNLIPWQRVAAVSGAEIVCAPVLADGELDMNRILDLIDKTTKVVALTHVSSVLGTVVDVAQIASAARSVGAITVIDGAQAVAHRAVEFSELGCDFYAFSGHKIYGPDGIGVLVGRQDRLAEMQPWQTGGGMVSVVGLHQSSFALPPQRFEAGTPPIAGAIGLAAALDFINEIGFESIAGHERALLAHGRHVLAQVKGLSCHAAPSALSVLSFVLDGVHPHDIATIADSHGLAIRSGHHCAQPLMEHLGVIATARASLAIYNQPAELDRLVIALDHAAKIFR